MGEVGEVNAIWTLFAPSIGRPLRQFLQEESKDWLDAPNLQRFTSQLERSLPEGTSLGDVMVRLEQKPGEMVQVPPGWSPLAGSAQAVR